MRHVSRLALTAALAGALCSLLPAGVGRARTPTGFSDTLVTSVSGPTALAFTPDERLLITRQAGELRV